MGRVDNVMNRTKGANVMVFFKSCPRCSGDRTLESAFYGSYKPTTLRRDTHRLLGLELGLSLEGFGFVFNDFTVADHDVKGGLSI